MSRRIPAFFLILFFLAGSSWVHAQSGITSVVAGSDGSGIYNNRSTEWIICDRELNSYYVPMETRRGFNAMESRGFRYRLRLVVELLPKGNVFDATDPATSKEANADLGKLRGFLNGCLSCQPTKGLLDKAIQVHGPEKEPSEVLTKAFNKSIHKCLDGHVPQLFNLAVDLFCDRKSTDWR